MRFWTWKQTKHYFTLQKYPIHKTLVDACSVGLLGCDGLPVSKRWRVTITCSRVAAHLDALRCDKKHEHSLRFVLGILNTIQIYCVEGFWRV